MDNREIARALIEGLWAGRLTEANDHPGYWPGLHTFDYVRGAFSDLSATIRHQVAIARCTGQSFTEGRSYARYWRYIGHSHAEARGNSRFCAGMPATAGNPSRKPPPTFHVASCSGHRIGEALGVSPDTGCPRRR